MHKVALIMVQEYKCMECGFVYSELGSGVCPCKDGEGTEAPALVEIVKYVEERETIDFDN